MDGHTQAPLSGNGSKGMADPPQLHSVAGPLPCTHLDVIFGDGLENPFWLVNGCQGPTRPNTRYGAHVDGHMQGPRCGVRDEGMDDSPRHPIQPGDTSPTPLTRPAPFLVSSGG